MAQCIYTKGDGEQCGRDAEDGSDYCWQHPPDDVDSEKVVEPTGKAINPGTSTDMDDLEEEGVEVLREEMRQGTGPNARVKAADRALKHVREMRKLEAGE